MQKEKVILRCCTDYDPSVALWMFLKAGIINPMFRPDLIFDGYVFLFFSWLRRLVRGRL